MVNMDHKFVTATLLMVALSIGLTESCFPAKYWISCLIDSCKLGGKCPGDPTAECRMEKTECDGCKPMWYTKTGEKANCSANKDLKLCPGGETVVHCKVDSCKWPCRHPDFTDAPCRQSYCGQCSAEYFIKGKWVDCPVVSTGTKGESIPVDTVVAKSCLDEPCPIDVCVNQRCPAVTRAVCRPYRPECGQCQPKWFLDNQPIDCSTGEILPGAQSITSSSPWQRTCAEGIPLTPCDMRVCQDKICRNFPEAECRPDGCGGCKDTWYVNNTLVDCLSDECPPKVPIVNCVDDPCKYFGHYCPAAECRASQCGKCEAKFYANGQEIDCAMPPKECQLGVQPRSCPWYTCPANICPSNSRLMCRINPCGNTCEYEFVDIYNGEILPCRVFDGDGRRQREQDRGQPEVTGPGVDQSFQPSNAGQGPVRLGDANPQSVDITSRVVNRGGDSSRNSRGGFNVEPIFVNPGPPIVDTDILSLLQMFPYEMNQVSTAAIQSALKNGVGEPRPGLSQQNVDVPRNPSRFVQRSDSMQNEPTPIDNGRQSASQNVQLPGQNLFRETGNAANLFEQNRPIVAGNTFESNQPIETSITGQPQSKQPMKNFFTSSDTALDSQLIDITKTNQGIPGNQATQSGTNTPTDTIYPELNQLPSGPIVAGKPSSFSNQIIGQKKNDAVKPAQSKPASTVPKGLPISIDLFSQWATS